MTAIEITTPGGPEGLQPVSRPTPQPATGEVLIKVAGTSVNGPDLMQRQGNYAPPPGASDIPGLDIAGTVVAVGPGVSELKPGDEVCALVAGGGFAEYCLAQVPQCLPVPKGWTALEAATLPETVFTVWANVWNRARLAKGESLLVHGGSSGIGVSAIQMARAMGATVFATARSAEKCAACEALGAVKAVNPQDGDWLPAIREATGGDGVDVVLDMVGGDYVQKNLDILRLEGRLSFIAFRGGGEVSLNLGPMLGKRLTMTGSTLRPRSVAEKGEIAKALRQHIWPLIEAGRIRPVIHRTYKLEDMAAAHREIEAGGHIGKIAISVGA
ncbi:MAG: NAD(P)H-quinone oxidoreductase [Alphaproteobacteria bacterium]